MQIEAPRLPRSRHLCIPVPQHGITHLAGRLPAESQQRSRLGSRPDGPYLIQFAHDCWTSRAVDGPVNAESPGELGVSGITNCIDGNLGNVAFQELERFILTEISDHTEA